MMESKESLKYVAENLAKANMFEVDDKKFSDKPLYRVVDNPKARALSMSTLTGLVDYIKSNTDKLEDKMLVHVVSPTNVELLSKLDDERVREVMVNVSSEIPEFTFGSFYSHESFVISLQSKFVLNQDRELVLKFAGTVEDGTVAQYGDDGVTQKATIKNGIASKTDAKVPNPVALKPYRTFLEVEQPESNFVFRMRSDVGVECAIFEADGGAWKNEAMQNIKDYLNEELKELKDQFTVIS